MTLTLLMILAACSGETPATETGTPAQVIPTVEGFVSALHEQGLTANEGRISFDAAKDCCLWDTCLHINPGSEYGTWALPPNEREYHADRNKEEDGKILSWRLRQDEAVVYIGPPPPGARYVSFRTYVHDTYTGGNRLISFANLGDSLNQLAWRINDDGNLLVVTTSNQVTLDRIEAAAIEAGFPRVNLDAIVADLTTQGLNEEADTYHTTLRVVGFHDRDLFDQWEANPTAQVFRITPDDVIPATSIVPPPNRASQAAPPLPYDNAVNELKQAILAEYAEYEVIDPVLAETDPPAHGPCWSGCNRDVSYTTSPETLIGENDRIVLYGVDPTLFDRAVWTAIVLHGTGNKDAAGVFDSSRLAGTAEHFLPGHRDVDALYAVTFARDCTGIDSCLQIEEGCPGIELNERAKFVWRHYLDPVTGTFPPQGNLGTRGILRFVPK